MKKLTTLAVAAALVAPMTAMADTTLYGIVDISLSNVDDGTSDQWDVSSDNNTASRLGVKGSEDLGNGLKAIFQYEWYVEASEITGADIGQNYASTAGSGLNNRLGIVGLTGGFGTVTMGRQYSSWFDTWKKINIMNLGGLISGTQSTISRMPDSVAYTTPNFNGFTGQIAFTADNSDANTFDGADAVNVGVAYANGPLYVAASVLDFDNPASQDAWGLSAAYNFGNFSIAASYQDQDDSNAGTNDGGQSFGLAGQAYFGNNTLKLVYTATDEDDGTGDIEEWAIGIQHDFSKRTAVYAEAGGQDNDGATADIDTVGFGIRHKF